MVLIFLCKQPSTYRHFTSQPKKKDIANVLMVWCRNQRQWIVYTGI